jgi:uncharacterized protein YggE
MLSKIYDAMRTTFTICACVMVVLTGFAAERNIANRRTISVSGTATTHTPPDVLAWTLEISDSDKDMLAAKRSNDQRVKAILGLRKDLGLKEGDVETGQVSIRREYEQDQQGHQGAFKHFTINRTILVRQHDLERFDQFLEKFVASAQPQVDFEFQSTRIQEVRAETRVKALQAAREKAAALAKAIGARLGKVLKIDEHVPIFVGGGGGGGGGGGFALGIDPGFQADLPGGTFVPGPMDIRITIYAAFELE